MNLVTEEIATSAEAAARVFGAGGFAAALVQAVRPFTLNLRRSDGGVQASGDAQAVRLARYVLQQVSSPGVAAASDPAVLIAATVDEALKRDLAYRFEGIPRPVRPMSLNQVAFVDVLVDGEHELVFGVGPTGVGKTHLALAAGLAMVSVGHYKSLKITRPHAFTPGDVVTPELRAELSSDHLFEPAFDILNELVGPEKVRELLEHRLIQMMPLGALPGRTLNDAFIVIDDAQNMNPAKLRMALTRLGRGSCMVVLGDPSRPQVMGDEPCGLSQVLQMIQGQGVAHVHQFGADEVVRNPTVARLEALYAAQA